MSDTVTMGNVTFVITNNGYDDNWTSAQYTNFVAQMNSFAASAIATTLYGGVPSPITVSLNIGADVTLSGSNFGGETIPTWSGDTVTGLTVNINTTQIAYGVEYGTDLSTTIPMYVMPTTLNELGDVAIYINPDLPVGGATNTLYGVHYDPNDTGPAALRNDTSDYVENIGRLFLGLPFRGYIETAPPPPDPLVAHNVDSPSSNFSSPVHLPPLLAGPLAAAIINALTPWGTAPHQTSPLVIDLSAGHTGVTLTTFNASTTSTFFDLTGDGYAQQTAWTSGSTGFLVHDLNANGKIDNINEMFGSSTVDGFSQLATLDSNHDLKIDSNDAAWGTLQVWIDANGDGVTQAGELYSLSSLNIASIDLAGVALSNSTIDGNQISHTGTVTFSGGATAAIDDAWFVNDPVNSYYNGSFTLDPATLFMPDLRGYGTVPDLTIAMSQDATLKGMVQSLVSELGTSGFSASTLDSDAANILYQWAGVEGVDPASRGQYVDARHLEFLEHLFGQGFVQTSAGNVTDPWSQAGGLLEYSWDLTLASFKSYLELQSGLDLFGGTATYNPWTGEAQGTKALDETSITALVGHAPSAGAANDAYWIEIATYLDNIKGISNLTSTELGWLNSTVQTTDSSLTWSAVVDLYNHVNPGLFIGGTSGADTLTGTGGDDLIYGLGGADTIHGGAGVDTIYAGSNTDSTGSGGILYGDDGNDIFYGNSNNGFYGGNGDDTIYAGTGTNTIDGGPGGNQLYGNTGNDTYIFEGGNDVIHELGGTDQIVLPSGITLGDLTITRISTDGSTELFNDLLITVANHGGSIQVDNQFYSGAYQVETLVFSDSSTLDLTSLSGYATVLTSGDDYYSPGLNSNQIVSGMDGNDVITTGSGNDTLDGGNGNDILTGGAGDDTYIASPGFDTINESAGGTDTINVPVGFSASDVTFSRHIGTFGPDNGLVIDIRGLGEILLQYQFYGGDYTVENLHFLGDSSTISLTSQVIQTVGTSGNDTLSGITAGVGGNWFDGRGGTDTIVNGVGNNTYVIAAGFGNDTISQPYYSGTNQINFTGLDPSHIRMWTDSAGSLHLQDTTDTSHSITVSAGITGSGADETAIGQYLEYINFDDANNTVWNLTNGLTLTGDNVGDNLYGSAYGDTITGGTGIDTIYGNRGNDTIVSGGGADTLNGGTGNDTYVFSSGFGNSTVSESLSSGTDTINFTGIDPAHIRMWTDSNGSLHLQDTTNPSNNITVSAGTTGSGAYESTIGQYVEQVTFDSSYATTWNLTGGLTLSNTSSGGTLYGTAYDDTLNGGTGIDTIYGNAGNDTIVSGGGADTLNGGTGNDTYVFSSGFGNSTVSESLSSGTDTINFTGIDPAHIRMWTDSNGSLHLQDTTDTSHNITVSAGITGSGAYESTIGQYVEQVTFDSSYATTWSLTGGLTLTGTTSAESLYGTAYGDTISGMGGNDTIYGNGGNDTIISGSGNDTFDGGAGTDTLSYAAASSAITISLALTTGQVTGGAGTDTISNFENLIGSAFNDTLTGDGNANVIEGLAGNDTMNGGAGTDTLTYIDATAGITISLALTTAQVTGGAGTDTISNFENLTGSAFNDTLTGDANANVIDGGAGNDTIQGGAGNDTLTGGAGTDTVTYAAATAAVTVNLATLTAQNTVGAGTDTISGFENLTGSAFNDTLTGDSNANVIEGLAGNDTMNGGAGTDTLTYIDATAGITISLALTTAQVTGGAGSDTISNFENLTGSAFADTLTGDSNNNVIEGLAGNDTMNGGAGTDTLTYVDATSAITISLALTTAQITGGAGTDTISNFENLTGSAFNDTLTGDANANVIDGGAGNDTIQGGAGNDTMIGGAGTDTVTYAAATAGVTVNLATTTAQNTVGAGTDTISGFENLTGSGYNDTLTGDANANTISGGAGNDTIAGRGGADVLDGGTGTDTVDYSAAAGGTIVNLATGTASNDGDGSSDTLTNFENITGSAFDDNLTGDANANVIDGGAGNDTIQGGAGNDTLIGGTGIDLLTYAAATAAVTVNLATLTAQNTVGAGTDTISGFENLTGSAFADTLTGDGNNNVIEGLAGNDTMVGGAGTDTVTYVDATAAVTVNLATLTAQNTVGAGTDTISGFENLTGSAFNDTLTGDGNNNVIEGLAGNDTMVGGAGTDTVTYVDATAAVTVNLATLTAQNTVGAGTDTISGFENLTGSAFNDTLTGDANANVIQGLAGNDLLVGGAGNDTLDGGTGTDTASYAAAASGVTVDLSAGTATGDGSDTLISIENVIGSAYNDTFVTTTGVHVFDGGAGIDTLSYAPSSVGVTVNLVTGTGTGDGSDTFTNIENIIGSSHNDTIITTSGTHVIDGGAGTDTVSYASASVGVTVNLYTGVGTGDGSDTLTNIENVTGSSHNDTFVSNSGNNAFDGGLGIDTVSYASAASAVTVNLAAGTATGDGTDTLTNMENVTGSSYADTITGNSGANVLYGGGGTDTLYGGSGADTFMFKALTALGAAVTIADYSASQGDKIDITDVLTGHYDPVTNAIGDFVSLNTSGSNTLLKVDLDGAGTTYTPTTIATITGVTGLDIATMLAEHHLLVPT